MRPHLPSHIIDRPKSGFGAPLRYWLRTSLRPLVDDILGERSLRQRGIFDPKRVATLVDMDRKGRVDAAYPIFALICVELWCRCFLDASPPVKPAFAST